MSYRGSPDIDKRVLRYLKETGSEKKYNLGISANFSGENLPIDDVLHTAIPGHSLSEICALNASYVHHSFDKTCFKIFTPC